MKCKEILAAYLKTVGDGLTCHEMPNGRLSVVLPYVYPDHDNVEIFVKDKGDTVVVSDLGETLRHLDAIGMNFQASGRLAFQVDRIASGFQVNLKDGIMFKEGSHTDAGAIMFDVLSACMAVGDLAYCGRAYRPLTFHEEVTKVLQVTGLEFEKGYTAKGGISYEEYSIDFRVTAPKRVSLVQAMEARTKAGIKKWVDATYRMWMDVQTGEEKVVRKVSLLNDDMTHDLATHIRLLESCSTVFRWQETERFVNSLRNGQELHPTRP
jgi:hypothetical protein